MAGVTLGTQARFLGLGLAASALLIGAATWRIRAVVIRQLSQGDRVSGRRTRAGWPTVAIDLDRLARWVPATVGLCRLARRAWPAASLDRNPVLWRECQRRRTSRWGLAVWGAYVLLCGGFSLYAIALMIDGQPWGREGGFGFNAIQVA